MPQIKERAVEMFTTGKKLEIKYPRCPHCSGLLCKENDGYEDYLTCMMCARQFELDMNHRKVNGFRMIDNQLKFC